MLGKGGTAEFEGYGDLSITELLPPLVNHYNGTVLVIVAPSLPDQAANVIEACMRKEWAVVDGSGKIPAVRHLTIVTDLSKEKSPMASQWLKGNPFGGRLTLVDKIQDDTVILLPDFAVTGPVNMRYGEHFTATATTDPRRLQALHRQYVPATDADTMAIHAEDKASAEAKPAAGEKHASGEAPAAEAPATEAPAAVGTPAEESPAEEEAPVPAGHRKAARKA